jgi:copper(I)-binding protein
MRTLLVLGFLLPAVPALAQITTAPPQRDYNIAGQPVTNIVDRPVISISGAFLPAPKEPGDAPAYLTVINAGGADRVVGVTCADAQGTTLSENNPKPRRYPGLSPMGTNHLPVLFAVDVPAHGTLTLKPGGVHIVLQDMAYTPRPGQQLGCTAEFEKYGPVDFMLPVVADDSQAK